jgi:hypothetical protein
MKKFFKFGCLSVIGVFVLLVIIAVVVSPESDTDTASEPASTTTDTSEKPKEKKEAPKEEKVAGIGEEIIVGKVHFVVNEISTTDNVGGEYGVNAQSQFLVANVTITNEKDEAITVDSNFFKLKSGKRTYESDGSAGVYANENADFFLTNVNPGVALTGNVVFDVPADLADPQMQVQTGLFGTETGVINLK